MREIQDGQVPGLGQGDTCAQNNDRTTQREFPAKRKPTIPTFSVVAEERLLAMAHDIALLAELGRSVALLSYIIALCGNHNQCVINLHEVAEKIGLPYSTVKSWLASLEQVGLIHKTLQGREGLLIELDAFRVQRAPVFNQITNVMRTTADSLRAVQMTVADVMAHAQAGISAELEVLS